jgi:hypothetical protein
MVRSSRTSANVITFPLHGKGRKPAANNWIFRIVESNEDLVAAMGILLDSYKSAIAGKPVCDAEVIRHVENALKNAQEVRWNAIL